MSFKMSQNSPSKERKGDVVGTKSSPCEQQVLLVDKYFHVKYKNTPTLHIMWSLQLLNGMA